MAQSAGLPSLDEAPRVYLPPSAVERIDKLGLPSKFIAINCTSNANEKNWPLEKWKVLIEKMADSFGIPIYELGLEPLITFVVPLYKSLCGSLSVLETAEVIRRAKLFIGIDSGPAHLANAVGTFGIVMIGSHLGFERYNPFSGGYRDGSNAVLLYAIGSVQTIKVDSVFSEVVRYLDKT
jgi:heptosyltransferase-3